MFRFKQLSSRIYGAVVLAMAFAFTAFIPDEAWRFGLTAFWFFGAFWLWAKKVTELRSMYTKVLMDLIRAHPDLAKEVYGCKVGRYGLKLEYAARAAAEDVAEALRAVNGAAASGDNFVLRQKQLEEKLRIFWATLNELKTLASREQDALKGVKSWKDALYL